MLDTLRQSATSWVAKILMTLLIMSFAVWGIADIFGGYSDTTVAEVGNSEVSLASYEREFKIETQNFSQQIGQQLTPAEARKYGVDRSALTRLIGLATLDEASHNMGLAVGDVALAHDIMTDPNLIGPFGKFDKDSFLTALSRNGISEKSFMDDRRNYLMRSQLIDSIQAGVPVPNAMAEVINEFQGETRNARYVLLPPEIVGTIADPEEKTIEAYYKQAAIRFTLPETRSFTVMTLGPKEVAASLSISDDDLKAAYEARRADYDVPEKRDIEQIPFKDEAAAKAALEKLRAGTPLEKIVSELGLKLSDVQLGEITRDEMLSPALADAAFALAPNSYSDPVKGPLGPVILHVTKISHAVASTFESAKEKLRDRLLSEKANDEIYDIQNNIEDARAGGTPLEEIADKNGLKLVKIDSVTAKGTTIDGKKVETLPEYRDLLTTVFQNEPGDQIPPSDNGEGGYYWLRVDAVTPATLQPLDKVREDVVALWKTEERKNKLDQLAQSLVERGNKGESIDKIAASLDRSALNVPDIARNSQNDTFSRLAVTRIFAAPKDGFSYGPVGLGESLVLSQVTAVNKANFDSQSASIESLKDNLKDSLGADFITTFVAGYQNEIGVDVNTQLLQRTAAADSGA
ncbi:MAG: hypothetical protein GC184_08700 [Rhizobiales bacterium]|nr:hypothetical protein [Hyphomicrobiales bacterium]